MTVEDEVRAAAAEKLVEYEQSTPSEYERAYADPLAQSLREVLASLPDRTRKSITVTKTWPQEDDGMPVNEIKHTGDVDPGEVLEALLDVLEAMYADLVSQEMAAARTPLHPVISDMDRATIVAMNARLALVQEIVNRTPPRLRSV